MKINMEMNPIIHTTKPKKGILPGFWETNLVPNLEKRPTKEHISPELGCGAMLIKNCFTLSDCQELIKLMERSPNFEEVGVQGNKDVNFEKGSVRTSIWSPGTAQLIWDRVFQFLPKVMCQTEVMTDWWQSETGYKYEYVGCEYSPVAISPLLRFMKYEKGGQHYPHYDAGFIYPNEKFRTLKSMVIYLTTNKNAATRFIYDKQSHLPVWDRNHDDWSRPAKRTEVIAKSESIAGNVLIFDHRLCHDVQLYKGFDERIIIRGDVVYETI